MGILFQVDSLDDAWQKLKHKLGVRVYPVEPVDVLHGVGRILAEDCLAQENLPDFNRSTVDGYAILAQDSFGASDNLPLYLKLAGKIGMGEEIREQLPLKTVMEVPTGGMLPPGADAVVMVEYTNLLDNDTVEIVSSVSPGENVIKIGEDCGKGSVIIPCGHRLRVQDLGALTALGSKEVNVYSKPKVAIISTGDELVSPYNSIAPGTVRDINSYLLASLVMEAGGIPLCLGIVEDRLEALQAVIEQGIGLADIVVVSGGSSVGVRDYTIKAINELHGGEVFVHGLALKPGKPTAIGIVKNKPVFGLPGNPLSAFIVFELFVRPLVRSFFQLPRQVVLGQGRPRMEAVLSRNIPSTVGREEYVQVKLEERQSGVIAGPILAKSGYISSLLTANGFVRIPSGQDGLEEGEKVEVVVYS